MALSCKKCFSWTSQKVVFVQITSWKITFYRISKKYAKGISHIDMTTFFTSLMDIIIACEDYAKAKSLIFPAVTCNTLQIMCLYTPNIVWYLSTLDYLIG